MTLVCRTTALVVWAAILSASLVQAVDVWTVGVNNTRQGWNRFETVLTVANVAKLRKIREFAVDDKIDVTPLVVGDRLYVFTMTNTAYIFDVNTGAHHQRGRTTYQCHRRSLRIDASDYSRDDQRLFAGVRTG
jgi:hypothetical protein